MGKAIDQVVDFFHSKEWKFELDEQGQVLRSGCEGDSGRWRVAIQVDEEDSVFVMISMLSQKCPGKRRLACAELISRINFGKRVGCFEMDFDTGDVGFKTSFPFAQGQLEAQILQDVIGYNLIWMDQHLPPFMAVFYAGTAPTTALKTLAREQKGTPIRQKRPRQGRFTNN